MKVLSGSALSQVTGASRSLGGWGDWLAGNYGDLSNAQAKRNYERYRERRDRSGDRAARSRSRSRSDMNSRGDQRSSDRRGGR